MDSLLWLVPVLGCGVGMILCMFVMGRMMGGDKSASSSSDAEVAALREEVASLRADREAERETSDG